jgi:hypothetical protein
VKAVVREPQHVAVDGAENVEQFLAGFPFVFGNHKAALQILGVDFYQFHIFIAVNRWVESVS